MRIFRLVVISLAMIAILVGLQAGASAEERFGPWVYYSPYYFSPDNSCLGCFLSPADWLPKYESPNPPKPSYGGECSFPSMPVRPPSKMARHAPRGADLTPPRAVPPAQQRTQTNQSQFRSSLRPVGQPTAVVPNGPKPVNHPGPQQRVVPAPQNPNQVQ